MKHQKKIKGNRFSLDPSIFLKRREETDSIFIYRVAQEFYKLDVAHEFNLIFEASSHKLLPYQFNPVYDLGREHYDIVNIYGQISPKAFCYWTLGLFIKNHSLLKKFVKLKNDINILILRNQPDLALEELRNTETLTKNWWAISTKTHILKELKREDTKEHLSSLKDRFPYANIDRTVFNLQMMSEGSAIGVFLNDIRARLTEYRSSGIQEAIENGSIESCHYLPRYVDPDRDVDLAYLRVEAHESIIDQYITFKEIVLELSVRNKLPDELREKIAHLAKLVCDDELSCALKKEIVISEITAAIVDDYTLGHYGVVISKIENLLDSGSSAVFGLIEIYAKSKIYERSSHHRQTLFDVLASDISSILQCKKNTVEKIESLTKFSIKFRTEPWAKSLSFHLLSILEENAEPGAVELARLDTIALGKYNTPKAATQFFKLDPIDQSRINILPNYRAAKYSDADTQPGILDESLFPVKSDYLKLSARRFLADNNVIGAIRFAISEYQTNHVSFYHLPFSKICEEILELNKSDREDYIACLIALDIYAKEQSGVFEESKTELFEEFMSPTGTHRPSQIFAKNTLTKNDCFFLQHICIPSQLDNLFQYRTNDEVVHERVAIIDLLILAIPEREEQLRSERDNVLETLFAEKLRAKIESGKLFVDVQALESMRKHVYSSLFAQAKSIPGGILLSPLDSDNALEGSKDLFKVSDSNAIASTEKTEVLYSIHVHAVDDFALNESYGLDKYLSAEVRHMVFITQLRSCFEKSHLVTVKRNGEYIENEYWINRYHYVNGGITSSVDLLLREFSRKIDEVLAATNEQFRVETRQDGAPGLFDFKAYHHRLVKLSKIIDKSEDADSFFKSLIEYMWEIASDSAKFVQQLIANDLASDINELLSGLEDSINEAKGDVAMVDLMQELKNARAMFTKQIEIVMNWFKFVGGQNSQSLERLGVVIEASVSAFESLYGHHNRTILFTQSKSNLQLTYREARSLFIAIFTAMENSVKYGDHCSPITFEHSILDGENLITIKNFVSEGTISDPAKLISTQKEKWTPAHATLNRKEGGTGLYKIFSILTNTSEGFSFDIDIKHNEFFAFMGLKNENFSNRG